MPATKVSGGNIRYTLDNLNTGAITIEDRDGRTRWVISVTNHWSGGGLSLSINAWDGNNYGTPNDRLADVAFSYNNKEDRREA